jgi:hypothetical protein
MTPVIFGTPIDQALLLEIYENGQVRHTSRRYVSNLLLRSGLIESAGAGRRRYLVIAGRHPALAELYAVLAALSRRPRGFPEAVADPKSGYCVDLYHPLAHQDPLWFRAALQLVRREEPVTLDALRTVMSDATPAKLRATLRRLVDAGVAVGAGEGVQLGEDVPAAFRDLVLRLGRALEPRDPRLAVSVVAPPPRPTAFQRAKDGAPRLFGTDVRLRNLMGLARHGALYLDELRQLSGVSGLRAEAADYAPFGRGGVVRSWKTPHGVAAELDPGFPLYLPLRRLLLKLEERYPLAPLVRDRQRPVSPPGATGWAGDKMSLFGGALATSILMSIGSVGWTFEGLCVAVAGGYDRVVVKKALKTLHDEGVLESDRRARPGFDVKVAQIAETFPARDELGHLLRWAVSIWPEFGERSRFALKHLRPRTRQQLRRRGLLANMDESPKGPPGVISIEARRRSCMARYYGLVENAGRTLSSHELLRIDSNLYRSVRKAWGSFAAFRADAGLPPVLTGKTRKPCAELRRDCISEYGELANRVGYLPNTADLNQLDPWLSERIRIQWGGFHAFCDDVALSPRRRNRKLTSVSESSQRDACRAEYRNLITRLGRRSSSYELRLHTTGLYKRIRRSWPSFEAFCDEFGVEPLRRARKSRFTTAQAD